MSTHPLARFTYKTFGEQFGGLVLAGYGAVQDGGPVRVYLTESETEEGTDWVVELIAGRSPCGEGPLVLAALLKLLVSRPAISNCLEFEMRELLAELRLEDTSDTRRQVDEVIADYAGLLYYKQVDARAGRRRAASEGGCYHLTTGYVRDALTMTGSVYFDDAFVRELKERRVCFAGIIFGLFKAPNIF